ncbi:hypothetical protein OE88DRAFT_1661236 [Heliocybe sulcata]|uniref:Cyclin N-terminal domain-containing protein n=1 Tax=Heliocybe sulcata TaxID=5364 RepID=A0A5C3N043_9AGAM|nr:hypothetical protein OE88DRAFT_1661236 [Heliocybe sulcata]
MATPSKNGDSAGSHTCMFYYPAVRTDRQWPMEPPPPINSPEHWLGLHCTCPVGYIEDDFVYNTAKLFLTVVHQSPEIFKKYDATNLALGALMLSRFLCVRQRVPIDENREGLEVMTILDRHLQNNSSTLFADILNPLTSLPLDVDIQDFYRYARDRLPAVPHSVELYCKTMDFLWKRPNPKITLRSYTTTLPASSPAEKLAALLSNIQIGSSPADNVQALLSTMRIS